MTTTPMNEPYAVAGMFVTGIARVDEVAPNLFRVTLCANDKTANDGTPERVVDGKLIITADNHDRYGTATRRRRRFRDFDRRGPRRSGRELNNRQIPSMFGIWSPAALAGLFCSRRAQNIYRASISAFRRSAVEAKLPFEIKLAGEPGFEPGLTESESVGLPLTYSPAGGATAPQCCARRERLGAACF